MNHSLVIKKEQLTKLLLIIMGITCQVSQLWSTMIFLCILLFCFFLYLIYIYINEKKAKISQGIIWYGMFFCFVLFSSIYTVNRINPEYVYVRMMICFCVQFFVTQVAKFDGDYNSFIRGVALGGILGIGIVLISQYSFIGIKRLGSGIYGSYAEFGNICMQTVIAMIWLLYRKLVKKRIAYIGIIISIIGVILSGARKAMLAPVMFFIVLQLIDRRNKINKKILFCLLMGLISVIFIYMSLNVKFLYDAIGYRIETGISTVLGEEKSDASLNERSLFKEIAKRMFFEKPITGWGVHSFAYENYLITGKLLYAHDTFWEILSCYGVVGFLLYFSAYIRILSEHRKFTQEDDEGLYLIAQTIVILIMEPFSISFLSIIQVTLLASSLQYVKEKKNEKNIKKNYKNNSYKNIFKN